MLEFLMAQSTDPFDPTPLLILADYLEERGDAAGAEALRGLASAEQASVHQVAISSGAQMRGDFFRLEDSRRSGSVGGGVGDEFGRSLISELGNGSGKGDDFGVGAGTGYGLPEQPSGRPNDGDGGGRGDATSTPTNFPGGIVQMSGDGSGGSEISRGGRGYGG